MNEVGPSLVTTYTFKSGKEYIVKIKVTAFKGCQRNLELSITDKYSAENWQSFYDAAYIENLTHKTGNYKHFDVFVAMLQSGLLKTSESITLDLLTFEDLELLRARKFECNSHSSLGINRDLQKHIEQLTVINQKLLQENHKLINGGKDLKHLLGSIKSLESSIVKERTSFCMQIQKLKAENAALLLKVQQLTGSANRKSGNDNSAFKQRNCIPPMLRQRSRSRSSSYSSRNKTSSLSSGSSLESVKTQHSPCRNVKVYKNKKKNPKIEFENLEARIHTLQKMLKEGVNLN